jgi:hypothetical protein
MSMTLLTFAKIDAVVMDKKQFIVLRRIGGMNPIHCQDSWEIGDLRHFLQTECQIHIFGPGPDKRLIEPANLSEHLAPKHCGSH